MATNTPHGPVDYVLIEFSGDHSREPVVDALGKLMDDGIIRLYDLLVISKDKDGNATGVNVVDESDDAVGAFLGMMGARSGILSDDDLQAAAAAMEPGTIAALIVYENSWAAPFVAAAREAGGELIASARIPAADLIEVLDAIEASA
jgi:uncharacterized membrane protein